MRLLILGSLAGQLGAASRIAMAHGAKILHAEDLTGGLRSLRSGEGADLVLADVRLDVAALIARMRAERITVPVIACGVANDTGAAVAAIRAGAKEYLPLPPDPELIGAILAAATQRQPAIIHADPRTAALLAMTERVAASDASILIVGPSGTGKEMLARFVHTAAGASKAPFVAVNCAAIPEDLLETELFGHEKGAFTGAVARRIGRFEEANGGTLLLDEISEMDTAPAGQAAARHPGARDRPGRRQRRRSRSTSACSPRPTAIWRRRSRAGRFREDLYFRLNVVNLRLPPLRERPPDIVALARHFAEKYAGANGLARARPLRARRWPPAASTPGAAMCASWRTRMHRAVLLAPARRSRPTRSCCAGFAVRRKPRRNGAYASRDAPPPWSAGRWPRWSAS